MEIRFIGQSCFFVKKNNTIIVTDPWCKESKAFYGAWIPFPYDDTKFLLDYDFSDKSLYIFLSHEHSDHLDIKLLKKLCNKNKNLNFYCQTLEITVLIKLKILINIKLFFKR